MKRKLVSDPPATDYVDSHSSQFNNPDISSDGLLGLEDSGGGGSSCKRARTIFTADQLEKMEQEFHKQQYVVGHERMYLANALNLTEAQVPNNYSIDYENYSYGSALHMCDIPTQPSRGGEFGSGIEVVEITR